MLDWGGHWQNRRSDPMDKNRHLVNCVSYVLIDSRRRLFTSLDRTDLFPKSPKMLPFCFRSHTNADPECSGGACSLILYSARFVRPECQGFWRNPHRAMRQAARG